MCRRYQASLSIFRRGPRIVVQWANGRAEKHRARSEAQHRAGAWLCDRKQPSRSTQRTRWHRRIRTAPADWQSVDRALRTIARRRAALDADEARWLREAEALQIWHPLGMVSALDYMERVLGYGPRSAQDRLRVARALGTLPQLTAGLALGELSFSAVRELTRVATPATEVAWREAATGKNLRQIEGLVADHRPGDRPEDPPDPEARVHVVALRALGRDLRADAPGP